MNKAAEGVYRAIRREGTQKSVIDQMQTRDELYRSINYYDYESALDKFQVDGSKE
jgi:methylisocitrate lyase